MERLTQRHRHHPIAIPAQLHYRRFERGNAHRQREPFGPADQLARGRIVVAPLRAGAGV